RTRDPAPAAQLRQVERRSRLGTGRFRASGTHGDSLLEPPHLGAAGGAEKIDGADPLMVLRQARELLVYARARRRACAVEVPGQLAVASGRGLVVLVARLVEQAEPPGRAHVSDLLASDERGLAAVALDPLGEPLKVLAPVRRVGQQVGGALERHRP